MSDVLILCYHAVSERWPASLSVTPGSLAEQLELLVRRGYRGATFTQAVTDPPAPKTVAVTFDDAFLSVMEPGRAILDRLGLPGTVFVPTDYIDKGGPLAWEGTGQWMGGPHESELASMSWDQLTELRSSGWEIGSHTRTHPHLTRLDDSTLEAELRGSREASERRLGVPCVSLAYPYGDLDARVIEAARAAGYETAAAIPKRLHHPRPLEWPRVGVYHRDSRRWHYLMKVSRSMRALRASALWEIYLKARRR